MLCLAEIWPRYVNVGELRQRARRRLNGHAGEDGATQSGDLQALGQCLLAAYAAARRGGVLDLRASPPRYAVDPGERPVGYPLARYQAASGSRVTNLRHESVALGELKRRLLLRLDGTRGRSELVEMLVALVQQGELSVEEKGQRPESTARIRELLAQAVDRALSRLASLALLVQRPA